MKVYKYQNFTVYQDIDEAIKAARKKKIDIFNHVYYMHPELGKIRVVHPKFWGPKMKNLNIQSSGDSDAAWGMQVNTNMEPILRVGMKDAPKGILEHEFKHRLDAIQHPSIYNMNAYKQSTPKDNIVNAIGNAHQEDIINPMRGTDSNRYAITERSADRAAIEDSTIQDHINYMKYLTDQQNNYTNSQREKLSKAITNQEEFQKAVIRSAPGRAEHPTEESIQKVLDRIPSDHIQQAQKKIIKGEQVFADDVEPQRAHMFIQRSLNQAGRNYAQNGFKSKDEARAAAAQQWANSGVVSPQLIKNLQGLVDHYNQTGQWFGYFSKLK